MTGGEAHPVSVSLRGPLATSTFVERPNRFVVRVRLTGEWIGPEAGAPPVLTPEHGRTGEVVRAHLADPGRLRELLLPGARVWLRPALDPGRATRWSAVLVEAPGGEGRVSVDTTLPNRLVARALEAGALPELEPWVLDRPEWSHGGSRFDFLLRDGERRMVVEVKSVSLVEEGVALFPDAVTARGARHVEELAELVERPGWHAAVLFVLQRPDAQRIEAARRIDPDFAGALARARAAGVRVLGRRCRVGTDRVTLGDPVPAG